MYQTLAPVLPFAGVAAVDPAHACSEVGWQ